MDYSTLQFLAAPFVASLIIAGIHAYLGVHVERGVIFVDLSLAQIAALGSAIALLLPIDADVRQERDLEDEAIKLERIVERIHDARKLQMVLFDACRDNEAVHQ